jgi:putative endonuclease
MSIVIGQFQEEVALQFLKKNGLSFIERNFRCKLGEIDLIMKDPCFQNKPYLVFVEVRYRTNPYYGSGLESIHEGKIKKLQRTAQFYLQKKKWTDKVFCRFDVISLSNSTDVQWIRSAFS